MADGRWRKAGTSATRIAFLKHGGTEVIEKHGEISRYYPRCSTVPPWFKAHHSNQHFLPTAHCPLPTVLLNPRSFTRLTLILPDNSIDHGADAGDFTGCSNQICR